MYTLEDVKKAAADFLKYEIKDGEFMDILCAAIDGMGTKDLEKIAQALMREL